MAKIPRKMQKIFGGTASNIGVFGSAAAGSKILSTDVTVLQSLAAWLGGWSPAVIGTKKFPAIEEMNAVSYISTSQIAYLLQEGIAEYDSTTTFFINSIVKKAGTYQLYGSVTDNNAGNALTDTTNWKFLCDLANLNQNFVWAGVSGGTSSAMNLTPSTPATSYFAGQVVAFLAGTSSTGATTVNLSILGAKNILKNGSQALVANDILTGRLYLAIYDGTEFQLLNNATFSHGADITTASTVNLSTSTGNILNLTGNNTITAMTLNEGDVRILKFTGAPLLTNSTNLILPTAANIQAAIGDYAFAIGYAAGAVQILYFRADGTPLKQTFSGKFTSGQIAIATASPYIEKVNHTLGATPFMYRADLVNLTPDAGYAAGDEVRLSGNTYPGGAGGTLSVESLYATPTEIGHTRSLSTIYIANKTTGAQVAITPASWAVVFRGMV